jgi:hypothetical protein
MELRRKLPETVVERFPEQLRVVHPAREDRLLGVEATRDRVAHDTQRGTGKLGHRFDVFA